MTEYESYTLYLGIKNHFTKESYDFTKYGCPKVKWSTFLARKDKYYFGKLAKLYGEDLQQFYICSMIKNKDAWIGDLTNQEYSDAFLAWKKTHESMEYVFSQDVDKLFDYLVDNNYTFDSLFYDSVSKLPIFKLVSQGFIKEETYIILDLILDFRSRANKLMESNILWKEFDARIEKYKKFLKMNEQKEKKYLQILKDAVENRNIVA